MSYNKDLILKYTRRKKDHDYYSACHYHIILKKAEICPYYGKVVGNALISFGSPGCAAIEHTRLGKIIGGNIYDLPKSFHNLQIYQYKVMPDHVHIFLWVKEASENPLGKYISILKKNIADEYSRFCGRIISHSEIFQRNYTDKIVYMGRNFDTIIRYIKENPYRLAIRMQFPEFFERKKFMEYEGVNYESYGNHLLLDNPFIMTVRVHQKGSEAEFEEHREKCLEHVAEGGVLVSPFIHPKEKEIRKMAEMMKGKIIKIQREAFSGKYKPYEHDFHLCCQGKLLIVAPSITLGDKLIKPISQRLNRLAAYISEEK